MDTWRICFTNPMSIHGEESKEAARLLFEFVADLAADMVDIDSMPQYVDCVKAQILVSLEGI